MLTFVIPTYNRPIELGICVKSIARQVVSDVEIVIIDNGACDETRKIISSLETDFPFVRSIHYDENIDYSVAHHRYMQAAPESDWVWTFGDDDILMKGALKFMMEKLESFKDIQFIHVSEVSRSRTNGCYRGKFIDLCCEYGWLDFCGFMTGNIIRGDRLYKASKTKHWKTYAKTAFVHSCCLLEELKLDESIFLDLPLINTQNKEQTEACLQEWIKQKIPQRYVYCSGALNLMMDEGILKDKLPIKFFRYLNYHLWDRFLHHYSNDYISRGAVWNEETWAYISLFPQMINDEEFAKELATDIEAARGMITLHNYLKYNLEGIMKEIQELSTKHGVDTYPFTFL